MKTRYVILVIVTVFCLGFFAGSLTQYECNPPEPQDTSSDTEDIIPQFLKKYLEESTFPKSDTLPESKNYNAPNFAFVPRIPPGSQS